VIDEAPTEQDMMAYLSAYAAAYARGVQ